MKQQETLYVKISANKRLWYNRILQQNRHFDVESSKSVKQMKESQNTMTADS
jgi:hypothetical protein